MGTAFFSKVLSILSNFDFLDHVPIGKMSQKIHWGEKVSQLRGKLVKFSKQLLSKKLDLKKTKKKLKFKSNVIWIILFNLQWFEGYVLIWFRYYFSQACRMAVCTVVIRAKFSSRSCAANDSLAVMYHLYFALFLLAPMMRCVKILAIIFFSPAARRLI